MYSRCFQGTTDVVPVYRRDAATWVSFAALFGFGILDAALGPVLPYLRQTEHLSYVVGALHQVAFAIGGMIAGLGSPVKLCGVK